MADEVKAKGLETKSYKVLEGQEIFTIADGNLVSNKGGAQVRLTDKQAVAFKDKIADAPVDPAADPATVAINEQVLAGSATIVESNALAGAAQVGESDTESGSDLGAEGEKAAHPEGASGATAPVLPNNVEPAKPVAAPKAAPAADKK